jgi:hypothetical protein
MALLSQIVAIEKDMKGRVYSKITQLNHATQRTQANGPLFGISRTYKPRDEEGEQLPSEATRVQYTIDSVIAEMSDELSKLFDITASKDWSNCTDDARADVTVDGVTVIANAPVPYLLFLEKQLRDIYTFVQKLPILDPTEAWHLDEAVGAWATVPTYTTRSKKVPRNHVKAEATTQHPAQVEVYFEDVIVGDWRTVKFSGALPATRVSELLRRVVALQEAVQMAREKANTATAVDRRGMGKKVFDYIFA